MSRQSTPPGGRSTTRLTRRTTLAAAGTALVGVGATGCGERVRAPGPRPAANRSPDQDPDTALLGDVVAQIDGVVATLAAVRRRERPLRAAVTPLLAVHARHRAVLTEAAPQDQPTTRPTVRLPRGRGARIRLLHRREEELADGLARAAVRAESGSFARSLASMSASLRQHLTVLDTGSEQTS